MSDFLATTPAQVGAILRGYRQQRGITQSELAARLGLPQKAISIAETHPERLTLTRLFSLLGALGVEVVLRDSTTSVPRPEW